MKYVVVRYGEIGTKSEPVRTRTRNLLRQRVEDRLEYSQVDFEKVSTQPGRIVVETGNAGRAAEAASGVPGVESASPAIKTAASIREILDASEKFDYGDSFAVEANRAGEHDFDSQDLERRIGAHIEEISGSSVDLDRPETLLGIDVRFDSAYLFSETLEGAGGLPVGSQGSLAALISGGIDSPVAAYEMMRRGAEIEPVYFFNKPVAAEDHLMRFEAAVEKLEKFHSSKDWSYHVVDMEEVNRELMDIERGRMLLHRAVMFRVTERIVERQGLKGMVTGEALGQKSSQTASSLGITSREVEIPVHRPLLNMDKSDITEKARELGTYEIAKIDSACRSLAPENPATGIQSKDFENLKQKAGFERLVEVGLENTKTLTL